MSNFFRNLVEDIKDEDTSIAADGNAASEYNGCIDTGSYILNAVLSGSSGSIAALPPSDKIWYGVNAAAVTAMTNKTSMQIAFVSLKK